MKATIDGIEVEGTIDEIRNFIQGTGKEQRTQPEKPKRTYRKREYKRKEYDFTQAVNRYRKGTSLTKSLKDSGIPFTQYHIQNLKNMLENRGIPIEKHRKPKRKEMRLSPETRKKFSDRMRYVQNRSVELLREHREMTVSQAFRIGMREYKEMGKWK